VLFVGDVKMGVGLHILAEVTGPWCQHSEPIFDSNFVWKLGYNLRSCSFDQLYSFSGAKFVAQKPTSCFFNKIPQKVYFQIFAKWHNSPAN